MNQDHNSCLEPGNRVTWEWQGQRVGGRIQSVHTTSVQKAFSDQIMRREASPEDPVLVIVQDDGLTVMKNLHEVSLEGLNMV